jgi:hypothetical protein
MLFFKSKNKTETEKPAAILSRSPRYDCLIRVSLNGYEGQAVLRNISDTGFRMESKTFVEMETGSIYVMSIFPETFMGIKPFEVTVEVRWILSSPDKFALGLLVVQPENRPFQKYISYLKSQARKAG